MTDAYSEPCQISKMECLNDVFAHSFLFSPPISQTISVQGLIQKEKVDIDCEKRA